MQRERFRVLAIIEAHTVTGPAKNLIRFGRFLAAENPSAAELTILTFHRGPADVKVPATPFQQAVLDAGIELVVIPESSRFDYRVIAKIKNIIKKYNPSIVQTHGVKSHFLFRFIAPGAALHWIAFHHGYTTPDLKMRLYNQLDRWSLPSAKAVVTVCKAFAKELSRHRIPDKQVHILANSIESSSASSAEELARIRQELGISSGEKMVLAVGRLSQEKGYEDLLEAAVALQEFDRSGPAKLVIVGSGPEFDKLSLRAQMADLKGRVIFVGHQQNVKPYFEIATILALPSHSEGCPNVVLEAMIAKLPIVATTVGGVPELVEHEVSALLVPSKEPAQLGAAMVRLLHDEALREQLAARAYEDANARFTPRAYADTVLRIYSVVSGLSNVPPAA